MKKQNLPPIIACFLLLFSGCKAKEAEKDFFIPAVSIINGQVNHIDTSLYYIIKVTLKDTVWGDTEYIRREDVRLLARDFLELPELSKKNYVEENIPGPSDYLSTILYKPVNPDKADIQQLQLIIDPRLAETGQNVVKSIYIDRSFSNRDSSVQKKLLWRMDHSFQVTTTLQKKDQPETQSTYKVIWNEDDNE
ncbi:MAG TPA: hypothetical protein VIZ28_19345 [Chitinophagaceae bacterium]